MVSPVVLDQRARISSTVTLVACSVTVPPASRVRLRSCAEAGREIPGQHTTPTETNNTLIFIGFRGWSDRIVHGRNRVAYSGFSRGFLPRVAPRLERNIGTSELCAIPGIAARRHGHEDD